MPSPENTSDLVPPRFATCPPSCSLGSLLHFQQSHGLLPQLSSLSVSANCPRFSERLLNGQTRRFGFRGRPAQHESESTLAVRQSQTRGVANAIGLTWPRAILHPSHSCASPHVGRVGRGRGLRNQAVLPAAMDRRLL